MPFSNSKQYDLAMVHDRERRAEDSVEEDGVSVQYVSSDGWD
jgi:hypothetical protein